MLEEIARKRPNCSMLLIARSRGPLRFNARKAAALLLDDTRPFRSVHPDYVELDAALDNKIDTVRKWLETTESKAFEGGRRVLALLNVDLIEEAAANAILKTVEEPGQDTTVILTCTNISRVIPTVLSRVFRIYIETDEEENDDALKSGYRFLQLVKSDGYSGLEELLKEENLKARMEEAFAVASTARELTELLKHFKMLNNYVGPTEVLLSLRRTLVG